MHTKKTISRISAAVALVIAAASAPSRAANLVWVGTAGASWSNASNWNPETGGAGTVPATADRAIFTDLTPGSGAYSVNVTGTGESLGSLGFGTSTPTATSPALTRDVTLTGGTLSLAGTSGGGGNFIGLARPAGSTGGVTVNNNLLLTANAEQRFNIEDGKPVVVNGTIGETGGSRGLHKVGAGTLILNGNSSYSGLTTARTGLLQINGIATGGGAYSVLANGTLGGTGTITGNVSVTGANSGIAPGMSVGTLRVNGDVSFSNGTLQIEINGGAGTADVLSLTGAFTLSATSKLSLLTTGTLNQPSYVIASYGSHTGTFTAANVTGLPAGYALDYNYNGLNQLALVSAIAPEPALAAAGVAVLTLAARRARRATAAG